MNMKWLLCLCLLTPLFAGPDFEENETAWRLERETRLKGENGWLNLAGLFWLKEQTYSFGSSPKADIVFPAHSTVDFAGTLTVKGDAVSFEMNRAQSAFLNGEPLREGTMRLESQVRKDHGPDILSHNNLRMFLIKRGDSLGLRVRDLRSETLREFKGIEYYPPRESYVVEAHLQRFESPKKVFVPNEIGTETILEAPGILTFNLKGKDLKLLAVNTNSEDSLFLLFTDKTTGIDTYASGRYLYAEKTGEDTYALNFNHAVNPPCAFTPYATCPFPPEENALDIEVKAGEKRYEFAGKDSP